MTTNPAGDVRCYANSITLIWDTGKVEIELSRSSFLVKTVLGRRADIARRALVNSPKNTYDTATHFSIM